MVDSVRVLDEQDNKVILEALRIHKQILTGGLVMAGGAASKLATAGEVELCVLKARMIDRVLTKLS